MFQENKEYDEIINTQLNEYVKNKMLIQKKVSKLLCDCGARYLIGSERENTRKLKQLGGKSNLVSLGGGRVIFKSKKNKFLRGMKIVEILQQRNLKLNLYGALYYELHNYEYGVGYTSLVEVLSNMCVLHETHEGNIILSNTYNTDYTLFNYVLEKYLSKF